MSSSKTHGPFPPAEGRAKRPSSPGRQRQAGPSKRGNAQLARGRQNKPKVQARVGDKVAAILSANVPPCTRERSPDAAPHRRRTASNFRERAPRGRARKRLRIRYRQPSPQEGVIKDKVSRHEATFRQCMPDAYSSPARAKHPAVKFEQRPHVSSHDSQADNRRAERPHRTRAQRTSRRKRPNILLSQRNRTARSYSTPEIKKITSPRSGRDVNQPNLYLSNASHSMSRPPGLSSRATSPRPNQQPVESSVGKPNTEVQRAKISLRQKQCTAK